MTDSDVDSHAQTVIDMVDNSSLTVSGGGANKNFHCAFDSVLGPSSTQKEVYSIVKGCTACVLDGFNRYTLFCSYLLWDRFRLIVLCIQHNIRLWSDGIG